MKNISIRDEIPDSDFQIAGRVSNQIWSQVYTSTTYIRIPDSLIIDQIKVALKNRESN